MISQAGLRADERTQETSGNAAFPCKSTVA